MPASLSPELSALVAIEEALGSLDDATRSRVIRWAAERYDITLHRPVGSSSKGAAGSHAADGSKQEAEGQAAAPRDGAGSAKAIDGFETLAEFYDAASPSTDAEKTLVVCYWFQQHSGVAEFEARAVNSALKHLGHAVSNITRAFVTLKSEKPAPMVQTRKEGATQQAIKKFKLTPVGIKRVQAMLAKSDSGH